MINNKCSTLITDCILQVWSNPVIPPTVAYMGHVTRITNDLVTACGTVLQQQQPPTSTPEVPCPSRTMLLQLFAKLPEETQDSWKKITEGRLVEVNNLNEIKPATEDKRTLSSDDDDADFHDIQFPQDSAALEKVRMTMRNQVSRLIVDHDHRIDEES